MNSLIIIILILSMLIIVSTFMKNKNTESFENPRREIVIPSNDSIYDRFYAGVYDGLFGDKAKVMFETTQIKKHAIQKWGPQDSIKILDVGCGTGWHTKLLSKELLITI